MKRDMDLVRNILLKFEARPGTFVRTIKEIQIENYEPNEIKGHVWLMMDAGLIVRPSKMFEQGSTDKIAPTTKEMGALRLTWQGHEFLDDVRDSDVWRKTKERAKMVTTVGFGLLWELAKAEIKMKLGLP